MTTDVKSNKMPSGIPFIVVNEFAERFCFYGINAILVQYMIQFLHFGDAKATAWQAMFKSAAYFFPLLGAMVSDIFLAKFRTIIWFSMVYVAGCALLAFSDSEATLVGGMFLMAFGTGGIKPCVSTNVGDQFTASNQHLIERAFSYFYFSINLGSSISIYFCPELLANSDYGPRWAFGVPAIAMSVATVVFWLGRNRFAVVPAAMQKPGFAPLAFIGVFLLMLAVSVAVRMETGNYLLALFSMLAQLALAAALIINTGLRNVLPKELVAWIERCFTGENLWTILRLCGLYLFIAIFWALWDQSNGNSWTVQAQSGLMDKHLFGFLEGLPAIFSQMLLVAVAALVGYIAFVIVVSVVPFLIMLIKSADEVDEANSIKVKPLAIAVGIGAFAGFVANYWGSLGGLASYEMLPAQLQVVNGLYILLLIPVFTFGVYPLMDKVFKVTPLRKIAIGFFITAASFLIVAWIEKRIQDGHSVSLWWQILAYGVLSASEVMVSITGLEFSYKQAPAAMKSFIMSLFLLSTSVGNALTATVNDSMVEPLQATSVETGVETWVTLSSVADFVPGQKIDFDGENGIETLDAEGKNKPLAGTYLVAEIDAAHQRLRLVDKVARKPVVSRGEFDPGKSEVSTYALVGPNYFLFFSALMAGVAVLFIFFAMQFKEKTHVREDA